jgi:hypothetical protein
MFYVHVDMLKKFEYFILRYLIKAFFVISACKTLYQTCMYNCLPEDKPLGLKHVEDVEHTNISLEKMCFVGLYCIIILQCTV